MYSLVQFRWIQKDSAPELHSWAIDDLYIGESCPNYCSGHGRCSTTLRCICDPGFTGNCFQTLSYCGAKVSTSDWYLYCTVGEDCATPWVRYLVPVFRDAFESANLQTSLWSKLAGGNITTEGCGPFRSYGFAKNVYFYECGERQLVSRELDLTKAWYGRCLCFHLMCKQLSEFGYNLIYKTLPRAFIDWGDGACLIAHPSVFMPYRQNTPNLLHLLLHCTPNFKALNNI